MQYFVKFLISISFLIVLASCGGGGGSSNTPVTPPPGGGGGGGSTSSLQVSTTSVSFEARQFQNIPSSQSISVTASGSNVAKLLAGYAPGVVPPDWLTVDLSGSATASTLILNISTVEIPFGTYSVPLRIVTTTADDAVLDTADITITYVLEQGKSLELDQTDIRVSTVPRDKPAIEMITLSSAGLKSGETINWERSPDNGVVGENRVSINPSSGVLGVGESQVIELTVTSQNSGIDSSTFIPLGFTVDDDARGAGLTIQASSTNGYYANPSEVSITVEDGDTELRNTSISFSTARPGETVNGNWDAESDQDWITLERSGTASLEISVDPLLLDIGRHEGVVSVTHDVSSQILEIPVVLIISGPVLTVSQKGIALSNLSNLTHQIMVKDSNDNPVSWTTSTTADWLTVTESGDAGDPVTFTADISGLTVGSLILTDVIISNTELANSETIQVGLWVGENTVNRANVTIVSSTADLNSDKQNIVTDPVRPYVYVKTQSNDAIRSSDLAIFNVYTGEKVGETILVDVDPHGDIVISDDGRHLYIIGNNNGGPDSRTLAKIDLNDMSQKIISLADSTFFGDMVFSRVKSQGVLISSNGYVIDTETETIINNLSEENGSSDLRISKNGKVKCIGFDNGSGGTFDCVNLIGSGLVGGPVSSTPITTYDIVGGRFRFVNIFELSPNGDDLLFQKDTDFGSQLLSVKLSDQSENFSLGLSFTDIIVNREGDILVATSEGDENLKVSIYDKSGTLLATDAYSNDIRVNLADEFVLSGDESRVMQLEGAVLYFMPTPAINSPRQ